MFITAHQGALPEAWLGEVRNDVAVARAATPTANFTGVFGTMIPSLVSLFLPK
jgi:hypothetical protein